MNECTVINTVFLYAWWWPNKAETCRLINQLQISNCYLYVVYRRFNLYAFQLKKSAFYPTLDGPSYLYHEHRLPTCMPFSGEALICGSRGSLVSVVIRLRVGRRAFWFPAKEKVSSAYWDDEPTVYWIPEVKRAGRGATLSLTSDAEVKNEWVYVPTPC